MENLKKDFLQNEILNNTIKGGFQRANIYKNKIDENDKEKFRKYVKTLVMSFSQKYFNENISSDEHIKIITNLQKEISKEIEISFGVAQKLLNLYLKYLWCLGELKSKPPHCPVDYIILSEVGLYNIRWTKMTKEEYKIAIDNILKYSKIKGFSDISLWELSVFNKINQSYVNT